MKKTPFCIPGAFLGGDKQPRVGKGKSLLVEMPRVGR